MKTIFTVRVNGHDIQFTVEGTENLTTAEIEQRAKWVKALEDELRAKAEKK